MYKLLAALGLTLLLLLGACGGGDDDSGDDASSDATATEATDGGDDGGDEEEETEAPDDGDDGDDGGDGDGGSASGDEACALLTPEELSAVVPTETWGEGDDTGTTPEASKCTWENELGTAAIYLEVQLEGGADWFDTIHAENDEFDDGEPVEGLGDEAFWQEGLSVLDVVDGDQFVSVQVVVFEEGVDHLAVATELAQTVLERI